MQNVGLGLMLTTPDGGAVAVGALNSLNTIQPFYLDGDFDVKVDFELKGALPPDGHVLLTVQDQSPTGHYAVERERLATGEQLYAATLGGLAPVTIATTAASGTLELRRSGPAITALADGAAVSAFTGAGTARVALLLTGALASCNDGGVGCQLVVVWRNARMSSGALVDRR